MGLKDLAQRIRQEVEDLSSLELITLHTDNMTFDAQQTPFVYSHTQIDGDSTFYLSKGSPALSDSNMEELLQAHHELMQASMEFRLVWFEFVNKIAQV